MRVSEKAPAPAPNPSVAPSTPAPATMRTPPARTPGLGQDPEHDQRMIALLASGGSSPGNKPVAGGFGDVIAAARATASKPSKPPVDKPAGLPRGKPPQKPIDLQGLSSFADAPGVTPEVTEYVRAHKDGVAIPVTFGRLAHTGGSIQISHDGKKFHTARAPQAIPIDLAFLRDPLAAIDPQLVIQIVDNQIVGYAAPGAVLTARQALTKKIVAARAGFGLAGFDLGEPVLANKLEGGRFQFGTTADLAVHLGGWVAMSLGFGLDNDAVRLSARGEIAVRGLTRGTIEIARDAKGNVSGRLELPVQLARFSGRAIATYADGKLEITGALGYDSEKLRGSLTIVVMEAAKAEQAARNQIDPDKLETITASDADVAKSKGAAPPPRLKPGERGVAGWGVLDFAFTDWFTGRAKAIFGPAGYLTLIGKIAPPKSITLLKPRAYQYPLFAVDLNARYGLPYVADIHVGIGVRLDASATVGPAELTDIVVDGVYSTDPSIPNAFSISGAMRFSASAGLGLTFDGHAGLTILKHDIDFGAALTATAGIRGYAEARPTLGYRERAADKKGEYYLKGHLEIAAQPFLGLGGKLFVRLDSPWWSPAPSKTWDWPLFSLEYPLPGQFGIGADVDYVIGSDKWPGIQWGRADFDASKFTDALMDSELPSKKVGGDVQQPARWAGDPAPIPRPLAPPKPTRPSKAAAGAGPTRGKPATGRASKPGREAVPPSPDAAKRWVEGMQALAALHDAAEKSPQTAAGLHAQLAATKQRFGFTSLVPTRQGDHWVVDAALGKMTTAVVAKKPTVKALLVEPTHPAGAGANKPSDATTVEVPKALAEPRGLQLSKLDPKVETEAARTPSGSVLYEHSAGDPKQVTRSLLASHPDARYDKATGKLTLPPVTAGEVRSLHGLATDIAHSTGVSRIIFRTAAKGWQLDGSINPTVEALASYPVLNNALDPLIASLKSELDKQQPNRDLLIAICRERAEKYGAKVEFVYLERERTTLVGFTEKALVPGRARAVYDVEIVQIVRDANCPACGVKVGKGGVEGTRPHNVIPARMWGEVIDRAFQAYGVMLGPNDQFYGQIRAEGTETGGRATTQDRQCRACEAQQDRPAPTPYSLVQRSRAPAGPNKQDYVGKQFKDTSPDQIRELTKVKIEDVVGQIRKLLGWPPKPPSRPATHPIYTLIVNPGHTKDLLENLSSDALTTALKHIPPTSYPP